MKRRNFNNNSMKTLENAYKPRIRGQVQLFKIDFRFRVCVCMAVFKLVGPWKQSARAIRARCPITVTPLCEWDAAHRDVRLWGCARHGDDAANILMSVNRLSCWGWLTRLTSVYFVQSQTTVVVVCLVSFVRWWSDCETKYLVVQLLLIVVENERA